MSREMRAADQSTIQTRSRHTQPWQASCARCCARWQPSAAKEWLTKSTWSMQPWQNTTTHQLPSNVSIQNQTDIAGEYRVRAIQTKSYSPTNLWEAHGSCFQC